MRASARIQTLCAIVDVDASARAGWQPIDVARAYLDGGARFLQVRAKTWSSGALLDLAAEVVRLSRGSQATVVVNDRADVAKLAAADGVHVGRDDLSPAAARSILGEAALVGTSTHTEAQIDEAAREAVDYIAIGPIFETSTKTTGYEALGLRMVARAAATGTPVVAIGGITLENARSVLDAGAASVAVIGDLIATGDPRGRVTAFVEALRLV
jgi:thiamine-phosphate pyrophosphorylase